MAESPSSTSEKPQIEKVGLGFLVDDDAPSDPIEPAEPAPEIVEIHHSEAPENAPGGESDQATAVMAEVVGETATAAVDDEEEVEFRNAIERDLCRITIQQAEIDWAIEGLPLSDEEIHLTVEKGDHGEGKDGKDLESVKGENDFDGGDEGDVANSLGDEVGRLGRLNLNNSRKKVNYPMRPDAEDCAYYMKFGSCKFGLNCKFNHPPRRKTQGVKERTNHREENSERGGQTECKYYLTSGGCKYGKDCKYSHGSERSSTTHMAEFNFLGLPIRIGEKECPYYMRTGSCKYGSNCRFHHPEPVTVGGDSPSGYRNGVSFPSQFVSSSSAPSWSSPRSFNETSHFQGAPTSQYVSMYPPSQGSPTSNPDWNGYQAPTYASSDGLPTPPAFAMNNLPADINFHMRHQPDTVLDEYPERPGEQECSFFLKTGDCKYRSNCKFHHPKKRMPKGKVNSYTLSDKGLPLRPDQPICTHYHRYGICKYGPACKYDHPSNFAILPSPSPYDQPPFGNSNSRDGGVMLPSPSPYDQLPFGNSNSRDGGVMLGKGNES